MMNILYMCGNGLERESYIPLSIKDICYKDIPMDSGTSLELIKNWNPIGNNYRIFIFL